MLEWAGKNLGLISGAIGSIIAIIGTLFKIRSKIGNWIKRQLRFDLIEKITATVQSIEAEVRFNGGCSVKDQVVKISSFLDNEFWLRPQPAFMCAEDGSNAQVSEAYCELVGVRSLDELKSLSWRMFIHPEDLPNYDELWRRALLGKQGVVAVCRFQDQNQVQRGKWRVRISPIAPLIRKNSEGYLFAGYFLPVDDLAKSIWEESHWNN